MVPAGYELTRTESEVLLASKLPFRTRFPAFAVLPKLTTTARPRTRDLTLIQLALLDFPYQVILHPAPSLVGFMFLNLPHPGTPHLTGDYLWRSRSVPPLGRFRPLRSRHPGRS